MSKTIDIIVSGVLLLAGAGLLAVTFGESFDVRTFGGDVGPAFAPRLFLGAWIVLAVIAFAQALASETEKLGDIRRRQLFTVIVIVTATAVAMTKVGFVIATVPGLAAFCWAFGYRRLIPLITISILAPVFIWALFTFGFELLLPRSPWFYQI